MKNYFFIVSAMLAFPLLGQSQSPLLPDSLSKYNIDPRTDSIPLEIKVKAHQRLLSYGQKAHNDTVLFSSNLQLGTDYYYAAKYPKALSYYEDAEMASDRLALPALQAQAQLKQGNVHLKMRQFKPALDHYQKYLGFVESSGDSIGLGRAFITMANCYSQMKDLETSSAHYLKGLSILEKFGDSSDVAVAASNVSVGFLNTEEPDKAIHYIERVLKIDRQQGNERGVADDMMNLGRAYIMLEDYKKAEAYFDSSLALSKKVQDAEITFINYSWMADLAVQKGDYKSAFEHFSKYHSLRDSVIGERTQKEIGTLEVKYETERKEAELLKSQAEIKRLEQDKANRQLRLWVLIISLVAVAALAYKYRRDKQQDKKFYEIEQELLQNKLDKEKLQSSQLKDTVELQQHNMTDLALEISRKYTYAEELLNRLEKLQKSANPSLEKEIRELRTIANNHFQLDKDREAFSTNIEQVNRVFYQKLAERFAGMTPNELELCGLIRLNFSNKDIAAVKGISVNSAKMARYRLRKKLDLEPDEDIVFFLQEI